MPCIAGWNLSFFTDHSFAGCSGFLYKIWAHVRTRLREIRHPVPVLRYILGSPKSASSSSHSMRPIAEYGNLFIFYCDTTCKNTYLE